MDQNIKNRLVGIAVIFALAVIFLPMVLDGSGVRKDKLEVIIPPPPAVDTNAEFVNKQIELQARVEALPELEPRLVDEDSGENLIERGTESKPVPVEEKAGSDNEVRAVEQNPAKTEKTGGDSWVLQVGSFHDRQKALVQRNKLRKSNIAAVFIEQFTVNDKASFRVRLGPFLNRDQTRVAQNKIKAKHDIDGIIMKYER